MRHHVIISTIFCALFLSTADANNEPLSRQVSQLKQQTSTLKKEVEHLEKRRGFGQPAPYAVIEPTPKMQAQLQFHTSSVNVHSLDTDPESAEFYPTALVVDERVLTYIAGTPVVTSPYLGSRPAFDGSDYVVNISSINRDIRLMQQRRGLERAYAKMGYPLPNKPILAFSGKIQPMGVLGSPYFGESKGDWDLGGNELDLAAVLNNKVEAYMGIAYNSAPPAAGLGFQRVANSALFLNMGFVNIGDLDESPIYVTAGQLFVPFGRYSTAMVSGTLPMLMSRTKARPVILGYKSQTDTGPFMSLYGYHGDTTLGGSGVGGLNAGYIWDVYRVTGEIGASYITSLDDATGMQYTASAPETTFAGFASLTNGNEAVKHTQAVDVHANVSFDRYNITAEWVGALQPFLASDLSMNGHGAKPQALQLEGSVTFMSFERPSSVGASYQWSQDTLALNMPKNRLAGVYNISIWKDTIESLEYRHDFDYGRGNIANGAAPAGFTNENTVGTGGSSNMLVLQIGVFF